MWISCYVLDTLDANFLGSMLSGKGVRRDGSGVIRTDEGVTRGDDVFFPSRSRSD